MAPSPPLTPRRLLVAVALAGSYVLLAFAGRELGVFGQLSVWYPPAGLALAAGLLVGWRAWPALALGELLGGVLVFGIQADFGWPLMLANAAGYAAVWVTAGVVLRRLGAAPPIVSIRAGLLLLGIGTVGAGTLAASFGVTMQQVAGLRTGTGWGVDAWIWFLGDAIGVATLTPAVVVAGMLTGTGSSRRPAAELLEGAPVPTAAVLLAPALTAAAVFAAVPDATGLLVLVAAPIALVAVRHGLTGVAFSSVVLSPTLTAMANARVGDVVLARTDLQVLLLGLMVTGYVVALPVEERRLLLVRLRRSEAHLADAQVLARLGSFRWDLVTGELRWSPGLTELFGAPLDTHGGSPMDAYLEAVDPDHRAQVRSTIERVVVGDGEAVEHEYPIRRTDGELRWVESRLERVAGPDGTTVALTGTCLDVTDRRRVTQALARANAREVEASAEIRRTERIKDALLAAVSHEVRTPLTMVAGLATTLARPELDEQPARRRELLDRLRWNTERLQRLLADLLDTDRLGRGIVRPHRRVTDLVALVDEVVALQHAPHRPVHVDVRCPVAEVDSGLVARMLEGMLANALRYTPADAAVWVVVDEDGDDLLLVVDDAGPGVPADQRDLVFERFSQGRVIEHSPGTGLGLHLVARFAELHGGTAWVEERRGGGASFRVRLPRVADGADAAAGRVDSRG